jgi:hydroxymethylpyrimidine pyrophosphatase-like HAD family hydrolase
MKFLVLALDYDGTIARFDVLDPTVRKAIGELRAQDITVMLVTGRILDDLRRVAGDLHFVDAVIAENGAVIELPDSGYSTVIGQPPPQEFFDALQRESIPFAAGRVIVEARADDGTRILDIVRRLELPLVLLFNRGRVMILPQAISKATGLRHALTILRLSPHNAVAIGDAENDHELLHVCELGVAVAWGSETLQRSADYVLPGDGPMAVAGYIRDLASHRLIPAPVKTRRRLLLGHTDDGQQLALAIRGRSVLVAGDTKSGKSWVTGLLCEQLILYGYCLCILDPEGDYISLESLPGVVVFGGADPLPLPRALLRALRHPDTSVVIDLSHVSHEEKIDYLRSVLPALASLRRHTGLPHRIVVDEAHYFLHDPDVLSLLDLELGGYTLVTYRASTLHSKLLSAIQAILVTRESDPDEIAALVALCGSCDAMPAQEWNGFLGTLAVGEAVMLPLTEEAQGRARRIRLAPRLTPHVRHLAKYVDIPVPSRRAFVFARSGAQPAERARTLREFVNIVERTPPAALEGHMRRGDFSRWIADVFGDYPLAKELQQLEQDYRIGNLNDVAGSLGRAVRARYEFVEPVSTSTAAHLQTLRPEKDVLAPRLHDR